LNECTTDGCDPKWGCFNIEVSCDDEDPTTVDYCDASAGCLHVEQGTGY
jgi:hypothetical protein